MKAAERKYIEIYILYLGFFYREGIPGNAHRLLLAVCSGITPDSAQRTIWDSGIEPKLTTAIYLSNFGRIYFKVPTTRKWK